MNLIDLARSRFAAFQPIDVLDLLLLGGLFFLLYRYTRHRRSFPILIGLLCFIALHPISAALKLDGLHSLTSAFSSYGIVILVIIFHDELRSLLDKVGSAVLSLPSTLKRNSNSQAFRRDIDTLKSSIMKLSQSSVGALILLERTTGTDNLVTNDYAIIDALISEDLIGNIFSKDTPLHDGAIIIRGNRIHAAGCIFELDKESELNSAFGSRHRAAISASRASDAILIAVSEEDGAISYAIDGELICGIDEGTLEKILSDRFSRISQRGGKTCSALNASTVRNTDK